MEAAGRMRSKVELFEQIRRDFDQEGLSKRTLALMYGVHRRTVREASESAVPAPRRRPESAGAGTSILDSIAATAHESMNHDNQFDLVLEIMTL